MDTVEIVIAKYKEDLSWITNLNDPVTIYDKSEEPINNSIPLKNLGRESQTYVHHILSKYDALAPITVFLQGNPHDHITSIETLIDEAKEHGISQNAKEHSVGGNSAYHGFTIRQHGGKEVIHWKNKCLGDWFYEVSGRAFTSPKWYIGACFAVSRDLIRSVPRSQWEKINETLSYDSNPVTGHYMERCWYHLLTSVPKCEDVLVAIAKHESFYINEWVEYHLQLGVGHIYLYDNEDEPTYINVIKRKFLNRVTILHFPGQTQQMPAYNHFLENYARLHKWAGFIDIDEFIILKKHTCLRDLLEEYCGEDVLSLNWYIFGEGPKDIHEVHIPVTQRFQHRSPLVDRHVKSFGRCDKMVCFGNPHYPLTFEPMNAIWTPALMQHPASTLQNPLIAMKDGSSSPIYQKDTTGRKFLGPFNEKGPTDVAYIHHYIFKSSKEFEHKYGSVGSDGLKKLMKMTDISDRNEVFDPTAFHFFSKRGAKTSAKYL